MTDDLRDLLCDLIIEAPGKHLILTLDPESCTATLTIAQIIDHNFEDLRELVAESEHDTAADA